MSELVRDASLPSMRELAVSICRDWRRLRRLTICLLALSVVIALVLPRRYEATGAIVVLLGGEYTYRPDVGTASAANSVLDSDAIMKAEEEILGAEDLHLAVMRAVGMERLYPEYLAPPGWIGRTHRRFDRWWRHTETALGITPGLEVAMTPEEEALDRFERRLGIVPAKDGSVIEISFRDEDPRIAAEVVDRLLDLYFARRHSLYADPQLAGVESEASRSRARLADADAAVAAFKASHGIASYDAERDLLLHRRGALIDALDEARRSVAEMEGREAAAAAAIAREPATVLQWSEHDPDTRVQALAAGLAESRGKLAEAATRFLPESRTMTDLRDQVAAGDAALRLAKADPAPSAMRSGRNPALDGLEQARLEAAAGLAGARARATSLERQRADAETALTALDGAELRMDQLERERSVAEDGYKAAMRVADDRRVSEAVAARREQSVRVIQRALPPIRTKGWWLLALVGGTLVSLMASAVTGLASARFRRGFLTAESLERRLGVPVLATVAEW